LDCVQPLLVWRARVGRGPDLGQVRSEGRGGDRPAGRAAALLWAGTSGRWRGRGCGTLARDGRGWPPRPRRACGSCGTCSTASGRRCW